MNYHDVICFTNALLCFNILRVHTQNSTSFATLIQDIKDLLHQDWCIRIVPTLQKEISCTNFRAKLDASSSIDNMVHVFHPPSLSNLLIADSMRI